MMKSRGWNKIRAGESELSIIDCYFFENVKPFEGLIKERSLRMARNTRDQNVYFETGFIETYILNFSKAQGLNI